jgi:uncharacterized protein
MSRDNVELVRRGYELYARGELEQIAELFSPDANLAGAGGLGIAGTAAGTRFGPDGFLGSAHEATEAFDDYRVEPEEFVDAGDSVVVVVSISGRGRESGLELEMHVAHLWTVRDGKVVRGEVHRKKEEALAAAGAGG